MPTSDDQQLIAQIRSGDWRAFEALYDKYKGQVYRTALAVTRDRTASEDILQDCFLRFHAHVNHLDGSIPLSPWLYRVTVNLSYNWLTRRRRASFSLEQLVDGLVAGPQASPEHYAESREIETIVQSVLAKLSFEHRAVVVLYYLNDLSVEEIALILGCPVGTVKSRLYYARKALRNALRLLQGEAISATGAAYEFT
ncbi:MAG: sigma-70 family RNA polymerase sigma factor [Anaerolineae bacterium]|nr:sigma-70 family RNA polymerase sigma factor [Anaerolineae bacterium]